ncbi:peroxidase family protein [Actinoplanes sp. NPDC049265]|uniref:peroxidase family protein n=1 Tax=Actinoplanes sp. NPDC049265 TaxID=3363902 RepID=UPI0037196A16
MKLRTVAAVAALLAGSLVATPAPAQAAPIGQGFTITPADLAYILKQIKIAEAHVRNTTSATGPCGALLGDGPDQLPSPLLAFGLRTVDGSCNHLTKGEETYGASDQIFPRLGGKNFKAAENAPAGLFGPGSPSFPTTYADKSAGNTVVDSQPRLISNLIADQTSNNPAALAAAGHPVRSQTTGTGDVVMDGGTVFIPNVTTDVGLSAPYNSWFTLFGQFFDHGVDQTVKGGGTVIVPLRADDPLIAGPDRIPGNGDDPKPGDAKYVPASMRFMALTRAANQPGPDGKLGTADDVQDATNTDSPYVDNSQTYTSHASHQVFLRSFTGNPPVATGELLAGANGGLPTWADVKKQAHDELGLALADKDVLNVPALLTDPYGKFVPGPARGLPQYVTKHGLVEGDLADPVAVPADVLYFGTPFLTDIAHNADPTPVDTDHNPATLPVAPRPDDDSTASADFAAQPTGTYDDEMLAAHYIAGDGRANENIGLTAVHQIFHSEHQRLVGDIERVLTDDGTTLSEWRLADGSWNGERIFQAARFVNEMEYQHIVFEEFARKIQPAINPFQPFAFTQTEINPAVTAEFAHAVYRFGHSMLTERISRTLDDGSDASMPLLDGFLNPPAFTRNGTLSPEEAAGSIVMGMSDQVGNELDEFMTDTLRDNLLGLPMDLAAVNISRGRSEGLPTLNQFRRSQGTALPAYTSWVDFGEHLKHPESLVNFIAAYGKHPSIASASSISAKRAAAQALVDGDATFMNAPAASSGLDDVDLWIGGLAEETMPFGGLLGSTFNYVFENQLTNLQNGDRLYYLARTPGMNLRTQLEGNSFAELIERNTDAHTLKADSFGTADCKFQLGHLARIGGNEVDDDPATSCDEHALLIRLADGTIAYRARNTVDRPGINGQSVFEGTEDADRVRGGNDNDTIWGAEGDDVLEGGAGNDVTLGGEGDDIITDQAGDDVPKGGPGNDAIDGGIGADIVMGGTGKDFTDGGANINETFAGEGDDFVKAGDGEDAVFGDSGDDWEEGGNGPDLLQGDSGNLFFLDDMNKPGNDVLIGDGGDDDYDMEGGDDIGVQGPGVEKNAGGSGYDWSVNGSDSDLALPLAPLGTLTIGVRDRFNEVEALSGTDGNDTLRGDDLVPSAVGGGGFLGCDALDAAGVARIHGLDQVVTSLPTPVTAVGNVTGRPCDLHGDVWGDGNILLGGAGDDLLEGRGGNDIVDGDRYLDVRLSVRDSAGNEIRSARSMTELQPDVFAGKINPGQIFTVREIRTAPTPGTDTAVFSGNRAQYLIEKAGDALVLTGPDGVDTVRNVEKLQFADETVDASLFTAFFGVTALAGDGQATALFTLPDVGGPAVTGLTLEQTVAGTSTLIDLPASATSFVARGLTNGVPVTFRLRLDTAAGPGVFSAASDPVTPQVLAPTDGDDDDGTENEGDDSGTTDPAGPTPTPTGTSDPTGPAGPAACVPHAAGIPVTPCAPVIGTATAGDESATVTWTAPASDGGSPIFGYEVQELDADGIVTDVDVAGPEATSLTFHGLTNGSSYTFWIRAVNAAGASEYSLASNTVVPVPARVDPTPIPTTPTPIPTTPTTPATPTPTTPVPTTPPVTTGPQSPATVPGAPRIGLVSAGDRRATIRWTAPTGGADLYEIQVVDASTGRAVGAMRLVSDNASPEVIDSLVNGHGYRFRVRAVNAVGAGPLSALSATVVPYTVAGLPASLTARTGAAGGPATASVTWTPPAGNGGAPVTGYRVTVQRLTAKGAATGTPAVTTVGPATRVWTLTAARGVPSGTKYRVIVQAVNPAGAGTGRAVTAVVR